MATQMTVVDYHSLSRRELQNLCKKHGIPANKTSAYMADALTSILKNGFRSATPTALSEDTGITSIPSTMKNPNETGYSTSLEVPKGNTKTSFEIGSERTEPMEEDTTLAIEDTYTKANKPATHDTAKTSEAQVFLQHVESSFIDDQQELCQQDAGVISIPSKMEKENERGGDNQASEVAQGNTFSFSETGLERTELMEDDTAPVVKDFAEQAICKNSTKTSKVQQVESPVLKDQDKHYQQEKVDSRKGDENPFLCVPSASPDNETNERDSYEAKVYTIYKERASHMEEAEHLDQEKHCQQDNGFPRKVDKDSLLCISRSPCKEANVRDNHKDKIRTGNEERSIHSEEVGHFGQNREILKGQEVTTTGPPLFVSHERLEKQCNKDIEMKSQNHIDINYRKGLLAKELTIYDETAKHDSACNQPPYCSGDDKVKENPVKIHTADISDRSSYPLFQFFVDCDNGIKLSVDLKSSRPSDWMKSHNYEFSLPQDFHEHKHYEHSQLKCPSIYKGDNLVTDMKTGSAELVGWQPWIPDSERFSIQNATIRSSNFLKSQNLSSTSPMIPTKKLEVELRRTSSVLIPPHGANRGLSPFMAQKSVRFSSSFISPQNGNNFSSSSSAIGNSQKSVSQKDNQVNCVSESTQPMMTAPSKEVEMQSGAPEKEMLLAKNQPESKTSYYIDEPVSTHASVEAAAVITPIRDGCQDVEMLDQGLYYSSVKNPKNRVDKEQDFDVQEQGFHRNEKEVESASQVHCPQKSEKEMQYKSLMQDVQAEEMRITSRYKDDYKKSPFTKNLRGMKSLARASTIRADILAKRRAMPLVENNSAYSLSSSVIHNVSYPSQNIQEKQTVHESGLSLRGEIVNENIGFPRVYRERDLCVSAVKCSGRENSVISPKIHRDRDLSFSCITPGKDPLQNVCNISVPSVHLGPLVTSVSTGIGSEVLRQSSPKISETNLKLSGRPIQAFAKKRFFEKALTESTERMQTQKMLRNAVNDDLSEKVPSNSIDSGYENQNKNSSASSLDFNLINSSKFETENEYNERIIERQKRHQEQFKTTPLRGKSKEKAMEVAKKMAFVQRNEILNSKRGIPSTN